MAHQIEIVDQLPIARVSILRNLRGDHIQTTSVRTHGGYPFQASITIADIGYAYSTARAIPYHPTHSKRRREYRATIYESTLAETANGSTANMLSWLIVARHCCDD